MSRRHDTLFVAIVVAAFAAPVAVGVGAAHAVEYALGGDAAAHPLPVLAVTLAATLVAAWACLTAAGYLTRRLRESLPKEPLRPSLPPRPVPLVWRRAGWLVERLMHVAMAACAVGMLGLILLRFVAGRWLESVVGDSVWTATMIGIAAGAAAVLAAAGAQHGGWRRLWLALRAWLGSWPRR